MKKIIFVFGILLVSLYANGQTTERNFTYTATIGTGIMLSKPSHTPFIINFLAHYRVSERFSAGAGSGFSFYEKMLVPLFADAKFAILRHRKFTPHVGCAGGYAFAVDKEANGGFLFAPSIGVQYALHQKMKLQLSAGYELQKLGRLKEHTNDYFTSSFEEKLNHHLLSIKIGISF